MELQLEHAKSAAASAAAAVPATGLVQTPTSSPHPPYIWVHNTICDVSTVVTNPLQAVRRADDVFFSISAEKMISSTANTDSFVHAVENLISEQTTFCSVVGYCDTRLNPTQTFSTSCSTGNPSSNFGTITASQDQNPLNGNFNSFLISITLYLCA